MRYNNIVIAAIAVVVLIFAIVAGGSLTENLNASDVMVIQYLNGNMETFNTPGWKPQLFGRVTKYSKRTNYDFLAPTAKQKEDNSINVRFNDAGHGGISGSIAWEIPTSKEQLIHLHSLYGSQEAVEQLLVAKIVNKAIYMTGPLMSSRESYAERRNELLSFIDDQVQHGTYKTKTIQRREPDPIDNTKERIVQVVEIAKDSSGRIVREDQSPLGEFGIRTFNLSINAIRYDASVEEQIKQQQAMVMAVQTSIVEAKRAEQSKITAEQNGMAEAAKAKWAQEVEKATAVTAAQQEFEVAELDAKTADQEKRAQILRGEGEAAAKRLVFNANGALDAKLEAWKEVNFKYAEAIAAAQPGAWTPTVVMGEGGKSGGTQALIDLFAAKTAREIGLDLSQVKTGKGK